MVVAAIVLRRVDASSDGGGAGRSTLRLALWICDVFKDSALLLISLSMPKINLGALLEIRIDDDCFREDEEK